MSKEFEAHPEISRISRFLQNVVLRSKDNRKLQALMERPDDEFEETEFVDGKFVTLTREEVVQRLLQDCEKVDSIQYRREQMKKHLGEDLKGLDRLREILATVRARHLIRTATGDRVRSDAKVEAFKDEYAKTLGREKALVFTYYHDTAVYLYNAIVNDPRFLQAAGLKSEEVGLITGSTEIGVADPAKANPEGVSRNDLTLRFAPISNIDDPRLRERILVHPIQLLVSTDVLSEGQNLQDAQYVLNFDLHWNPVRMIQRAGRIDRIGNPHPTVNVTNVFPDKELDSLLNLVERLQDKILQIDAAMGLDASVLGEVIRQRTFEDLRRIRANDRAIVEELEREMDFATLDEMRLPLVAFLRTLGEEVLSRIPLGVHSGFSPPLGHAGGVLFAFRHRVSQGKPDHHWLWWSLEDIGRPKSNELWVPKVPNVPPLREKRRIFPLVSPPDGTGYHVPAHDIFPLLGKSVDELVGYLNVEREAAGVMRAPGVLNARLIRALLTPGSDDLDPDERTTAIRVLQSVSLEPSRRDKRSQLKAVLDAFDSDEDSVALAHGLTEFFRNQDWLTPEGKPKAQVAMLDRPVRADDLELVAYLVVAKI